MNIESFPQEVTEALKHYVYRLIDPRNGETFYVGRGQGNRVFAHAKGDIDESAQSAEDAKLRRIDKIRGTGMEVEHIIHRHGMTEEAVKEVEAALIDAYPGLTNKVAGEGSDRGAGHATEMKGKYSAEEFVVGEHLILISIANTWEERGTYGAVRGLWGMKFERVSGCKYKLVLAHVRGIVRGAYRPTKWMYGTEENFRRWENWKEQRVELSKRVGFDGDEAEPEVWSKYVGKRVPPKYRKPGAQAPFRYLDPD